MGHRTRGRPKGPAQKFGPQTIYAVHKALRECLPGKSPTEIARMVGEALYVPPMISPHETWIEVEFEFADGLRPQKPIIIRASREAQVRETIGQRGQLALWRSRPCAAPELRKPKSLGNSAAAIATHARRLIKAVDKK